MLRLAEEKGGSSESPHCMYGEYTAVLIAESGARPRFYLQLKIRPEKIFHNRIALFGGHMEPSDQTAEFCAIRELREETGLDFHESELVKLGAVNTFDDHDNGAIGHVYLIPDLDPKRFRKRKINEEGRLLRLSLPAVRRRWMELTPVAAFAMLQYGVWAKLNGVELPRGYRD